jgi:uncharacterized tellurite resistance protein B-like protein
MTGLLEKLRALVLPPMSSPPKDARARAAADEQIALGVLLWAVAEADGRFHDEELAQIREILARHGVAEADLAVVMASVEQAARARIDLYAFAREVADGLGAPRRVEIVTQLYRVACADGDLAHTEIEIIRQISRLLRVPHDDFIAAKIAVKAEFGV